MAFTLGVGLPSLGNRREVGVKLIFETLDSMATDGIIAKYVILTPERKRSMKKAKFYQAACMMAAFFVAGAVLGLCGQASHSTTEPASSSTDAKKVVLKVGNVQVTQSDIDFLLHQLSPQAQQQVEREGKRSVGEQYATMLVLSQVAQSQHLDSSPVFQQAMQQHRNQLLAELEYQNLLKKAAVSPAEVNQYYAAHRSDFQEAQIREVAIRKKGQGAQANAQGFSSEEARAKADTIRKALVAGQDPKVVAKNFSVPQEVIVETEPKTIQNSPSLPQFVKSAFQLKPGEVSQVEDTPNAVYFFQVVSHPQVSLKDATPEIENALRSKKVQSEVNDLKKNMPIWMDQTYFGSTDNATPSTPQP